MAARHAPIKHQREGGALCATQLKASKAWARKDTSKTSHELKAAASHLERALTWSGHEIEAGVVKVMETGHAVG